MNTTELPDDCSYGDGSLVGDCCDCQGCMRDFDSLPGDEQDSTTKLYLYENFSG